MRFRFELGIAIAAFGLSATPAHSSELAILRNGFTIRYERLEPMKTTTRLYTTGAPNDFVDVPTVDIIRYEKIAPPPVEPEPAPSPAPAPTLDQVIAEASNRNKVDRDLVISLILAESGFNAKAVSAKGAMGLMQLMPQTAIHLGVKDPMDPASNVEGGTRYLREMLELFHNDITRALAAYNAGPEQVALHGGVPPYPETRAYVARILHDFNRKKAAGKNLNLKRQFDRSPENPQPVLQPQFSSLQGF